jgi:hypothetical protein
MAATFTLTFCDPLGNDISRFRKKIYRCVEDHFEQLETGWLPARRAYSSERMNVISAALAFGGLM